MPKENIFSGKYEPDRDTCTEANESNVARFRTAMLKKGACRCMIRQTAFGEI